MELLTGCETWTINRQIIKKLEATKDVISEKDTTNTLDGHKNKWKDLQKSFRTKKTKKNQKKNKLVIIVRKRQSKFPAHVMGRMKSENLVMTGKFKGKKRNRAGKRKVSSTVNKWHFNWLETPKMEKYVHQCYLVWHTENE